MSIRQYAVYCFLSLFTAAAWLDTKKRCNGRNGVAQPKLAQLFGHPIRGWLPVLPMGFAFFTEQCGSSLARHGALDRVLDGCGIRACHIGTSTTPTIGYSAYRQPLPKACQDVTPFGPQYELYDAATIFQLACGDGDG